MVALAKDFKGRIAGRFYAEFLFYLIAFTVLLYYSLQPQHNPWVIVAAVIAGLLFVEMTNLMVKNAYYTDNAFVGVDKDKIVYSDPEDKETLYWKDVDFVEISWLSEDKWLEAWFGLDPSILIRKKRSKFFDVSISPDFFDTKESLNKKFQQIRKEIN